MISRLLSSLQHPIVKKYVKLKASRVFRHEQQTVIITGRVIVQEIAAQLPLKTVVSCEPLPVAAQESYLATPAVIQKIIGHETDDLVVAEVAMPVFSAVEQSKLLIVLDQIKDPGNVGTIFRTALALGWDGIYVTEGSADPYNDKALRASRGASLVIPWQEGSWDELKKLCQGRHVVIADIQGEPLSQISFQTPLVLVLGHETKGPSSTARAVGTTVMIPMQGKMESLNVAAAASILLYHIKEAL